MNILYINPGTIRHGSTYRARGVCQLLRNIGHKVVYAESNHTRGKDVISIQQRDSFFGYLSATLIRCGLCYTCDYDVLYLQKAWPLTLGCMVIAKLRKKKVFIDFDDLDSEWQSSPFRRKLMHLTERWMPKYADVVTTHNHYLRRFIQGRGCSQVFIVPQGIDIELFSPQKYSKQKEKKRLGLDNKVVLCFLGSFTIGSSQDLHLILKAMKEIEQRGKKIHLLIIGGGGPLEEHYLQMIKDLRLKNIHITGRIPHEHVPRYLAACDMGLVFMEEVRANKMRMSLKLIEYLSMDLPVVGHITGENFEVFGKYCFFCEPTARSMAEVIIEAFEKGWKSNSVRAFILQHYSWKSIESSVKKLLRNV